MCSRVATPEPANPEAIRSRDTDSVEAHFRLLASHVHSFDSVPGEVGSVGGDEKEAHSGTLAGRYDQHVGVVSVDHVQLGAVQNYRIAIGGGLQGNVGGVPATAFLGDRESEAQLTASELRQDLSLLVFGARDENRRATENYR